MKRARVLIGFSCTVAVALVVASAASGQETTGLRGGSSPLTLEVAARDSIGDPELEAAPDVTRYTVDWARKQIPSNKKGRTARLIPSQGLPFLPPSNLIEMEPVWKRAGHNKWIVLGRGHYTLPALLDQLGSSGAIRREPDGSYLLRRPLYVAPTGSLSLSDGEWLKLSTPNGAILVSNGRVVAVDARISAWDEGANAVPPRPKVEKSKARLWSTGEPRPYLLFQNGSQTWIANSELIGLGYMGGYGSYGLSFSATLAERSLNRYLQSLPRPRGWLIGNRIEDLFFGVYSNRVQQLVIVGNDFDKNLIYGIDPHDHSRGVVIARNVARKTAHSHGIIISRDVSGAHISENLSLDNGGSGIVLDRQSQNVRVEGNVAIANAGDGVALFESGSALLQSNHALLNKRNGIYVRNSTRVVARDNQLSQNGDDGLEVTAQFLKPGSRKLDLDPYEARATARLDANRFRDNAKSAISAKGVRELSMTGNLYVDSGPSYFGGELKPISASILQQEPKDAGDLLIIRNPKDVTP